MAEEVMEQDELLTKDEIIPICQKYFKELLGEEIPKEHIILDFVYPLLKAQLAKQHYEQKGLDRPELSKGIDKIILEMENDGNFQDAGSILRAEYRDKFLVLIPEIEVAKKQSACDLFEEIICPMCYRLNPQHATMDDGEGCHYCQEREDWQALGEK